jgi:hypothetical protein
MIYINTPQSLCQWFFVGFSMLSPFFEYLRLLQVYYSIYYLFLGFITKYRSNWVGNWVGFLLPSIPYSTTCSEHLPPLLFYYLVHEYRYLR